MHCRSLPSALSSPIESTRNHEHILDYALNSDDEKFLRPILESVRVCAKYKPKFGKGSGGGLELDEFRHLYGQDAFYSWFGLDNPLMYAAHKAAGGMTSIYRQIGIGCEQSFRLVLRHSLGLSESAVNWSYSVIAPNGKRRTLSLDGRIPTIEIGDLARRKKFQSWLTISARQLGVSPDVVSALKGAVFEVRQGYKSKDSKRQNADIANATNAYVNGYLPCAVVLSTQIDTDILHRYRMEKWSVLIGTTGENSSYHSTYDFMREIVGYDFGAFLTRHSNTLRAEVDSVLRALLTK